jgi:hypothetical protein
VHMDQPAAHHVLVASNGIDTCAALAVAGLVGDGHARCEALVHLCTAVSACGVVHHAQETIAAFAAVASKRVNAACAP